MLYLNINILRVFSIDLVETISISNIVNENLILRRLINQRYTYTIPNAIDNTKFRPALKNN